MAATDAVRRPFAAALIAVALVAWFASGGFGKDLLAEIAIFAILAMSLDLLVGTTGMVSLGHAAFFGIGAYATAGLVVGSGWPLGLAMPAAIAISALAAALTGVFMVRLGGVFFIIVTLAVGQMAHAFFFKNRAFGGSDGMAGTPRLALEPLGIDLGDPAMFALFAMGATLMVYLALEVVTASPFGRMLVGIRENEQRMRALGCPVTAHKLAAFVLAGALAGLAGSLTAQHTGFVSPELAFWTVSGEVLVMVIIGGQGRLGGAVAGAAVVILLRHELSSLTEYWTFLMGLFFIAVALFARGGLYGAAARAWAWRPAR